MSRDTLNVHPVWLRLTHWLNAIALIVLVLSGWRIYNAAPLFAFRFPPSLTLGGWLGGALMWHFVAMWLLFVNGLIYLLTNLFSGRLRRRFFPLRPAEPWRTLLETFRGKLAHARCNGSRTLASVGESCNELRRHE